MSSTAIPKVVPARLSFLAIYNPALGTSDETFHNQVVFYYSKDAKPRFKTHGSNARAEGELREQENEKLRQVGLAQGMVGFARSFSNGAAVDSVETDKARIVLYELETGWWVLVSIDLTQLPVHHSTSTSASASTSTSQNTDSTSEPAVEYSSREVSPPALLLQQLVRAHRTFLLHHGETLGHLFSKLGRDKFMTILEKYWSRFAASWDVLLHGSPAVEIYNGMKLAAGGELGMGVGEEEWGSGERLVLEDYVQKTYGLVDLMVCRFGEPSPLQHMEKSSSSEEVVDTSETEPWIGSGGSPNSADGTVFSGVGAVSRRSLRDLSHWIEAIYCHGDHAYGVRDNPTADRRRRRRKSLKRDMESTETVKPYKPQQPERNDSKKDLKDSRRPGIPPPVVRTVEASLDRASAAVDASINNGAELTEPPPASLGDTETWMKYLTLGYGTAWGGKKASGQISTQEDYAGANDSSMAPMRYVDPEPDVDHAAEKLQAQLQLENTGYFAIGLKGDMNESDADDENDEGDWNNRTVLRTVYVELNPQTEPTDSGEHDHETLFEGSLGSTPSSLRNLTRLRPVVYVHRPFIYTFLFKHRTEALAFATFYRNLHTYFSPLHRPLSNSTSPHKVAARISAASDSYTTTSASQDKESHIQPIYDLAYDPRTMTVHSTLPNIPDPGTLIAEGLGSSAQSAAGWSRVDALNVHSQIIATASTARRNLSEIERTSKTSRGWWVVWMRLPPSQVEHSKDQDPAAETEDFDTDQLREAFLVRKATDAVGLPAKTAGSRFGSAMWGGSLQKTSAGPKGGMAEGIGIDARRYVEGLLSLNR